MGSRDDINLIWFLKYFWFQRKFIFTVTLICSILALFYTMRLDDIYKSSVTMLPQYQAGGNSQLTGLAAMAGVDLVSQSSSNNENFYFDLLKSNLILDQLIKKKWAIGEQKQKVLLQDFLNFKLDNDHFAPQKKLDNDLKKYLREKVISFTTSKDNGLMTLSVSLPLEPSLSAEIANWLASQLHIFNENYRQKKALENVNSIQAQLEASKKGLMKAQDILGRFHKTNKNYSQSVELQIEYSRLQNEVLTENTVYTELRKQYELAKIDLEKSKNTIVILDHAEAPVQKDKPNRLVTWFILSLLSAIFAFILSILKISTPEKK
jgi:uncharacterized protein involved in exopolysaccharide biosynthesis